MIREQRRNSRYGCDCGGVNTHSRTVLADFDVRATGKLEKERPDDTVYVLGSIAFAHTLLRKFNEGEKKHEQAETRSLGRALLTRRKSKIGSWREEEGCDQQCGLMK
jgi:hypothetical protein